MVALEDRRPAAPPDLGLTLGRQSGMGSWLAIEFIFHRPAACAPWHLKDPTRPHALEDVQAVIELFELKMWTASKGPSPCPSLGVGAVFCST